MSKNTAANSDDMIQPASFEDPNWVNDKPAVVEDDDMSTPGYLKPKYSSNVDTFEDEDTSYLRLRLAQSNTSEVIQRTAEIADIVMTGFAPMKSVVAIPCQFARMRAYSTGAGNDKMTYCVSSDAINGLPNFELIKDLPVKPTGVCGERTCPCARWMDNPRTPGKNKPPLCDTIFSYIMYLPALKTLADLRLKKTQINAAKMINNLAQARGFGHFAVELYCTKQFNDKAKDGFAVPQVTVINDYDPIVLKTARELSGIEIPTKVTEVAAEPEAEFTEVS